MKLEKTDEAVMDLRSWYCPKCENPNPMGNPECGNCGWEDIEREFCDEVGTTSDD